jgi:hypothetical protein
MFVEDIRRLAEYFGEGKKLIVLVLSDLDPSGNYIKGDYINKFKFMEDELSFTMPITFEKIALTPEQVQQYNLPWIKKNYRNEILDIVELDALPPNVLREIVKDAIEKYMDMEQLYEDLQIEKREKETLQFLIEEGLETYSDSLEEDE